jgi:hypothetical protein
MIFTNERIQKKKNSVLGLFGKLEKYEWKLNRLTELMERGKIEIMIKSTYDTNDMIPCADDIDTNEFLQSYKTILEDKIKNTENKIDELVNTVSTGESK